MIRQLVLCIIVVHKRLKILFQPSKFCKLKSKYKRKESLLQLCDVKVLEILSLLGTRRPLHLHEKGDGPSSN